MNVCWACKWNASSCYGKLPHPTDHTNLSIKSLCFSSITIASLNEQRQAKHSQTTDIQCLSLEKNQETTLIFMDQELSYPLSISVNLLVVSPNKIGRENTPSSVPAQVKLPTDNVNESDNEPKSATSESNLISSTWAAARFTTQHTIDRIYDFNLLRRW